MIKRFGALRFTVISGICFALGITVLIDAAMLVVPIYDMQLYDRVLMSRNMDTLVMLSVACIVGLTFYGFFEYFRSAIFIAISEIVSARLQGPALEEGIRRAAAGDQRAGPELIRNVYQLQTFLGSGALAVPLDAACTPLFIGVLFILNPSFGWLALVGISAITLFGLVTDALISPRLKLAHEQREFAGFRLTRTLADKDVVDGLGMLPAIARLWCLRNMTAMVGLTHAANVSQLVGGVSRLIRLLLQAGVMVLGAFLIVHGQTTPGSLMGANLLLSKSLGPFDHLVESWRNWIAARRAWEGIACLLVKGDRGSNGDVVVLDTRPGLVIDRLQVRLGSGRPLISETSAYIMPGQMVVLVGANGSGKTTLLRVLAGVVQPSEGSVSLDRAMLSGGPHIGYLPQSVSLMDGSIMDNVGRFQPDVHRVFETAKQVGIHDLVGRMSLGYDTHLTGDALNLSGGIRQRIGLARALYGDPRLLLLDEPDSSLDAEGAEALLSVIRRRCEQGAITVVISHRAAMRHAADRVMELRDGVLVEHPTSARCPSAQSEISWQ